MVRRNSSTIFIIKSKHFVWNTSKDDLTQKWRIFSWNAKCKMIHSKCCMWIGTFQILHAKCQTLHVKCYMPNATCQMLHAKCYMPIATCQMLHFTHWIIFFVCYAYPQHPTMLRTGLQVCVLSDDGWWWWVMWKPISAFGQNQGIWADQLWK